MIVRGSWAGGAARALYEWEDQVTKVKVYAWDNTVSPAVWKQLTGSNGNQIIDTYVPQVKTPDSDGPEYNKKRNKLSEHMFSKPVTTSRIKIEIAACAKSLHYNHHNCWMRTGLIGPHAISSAVS